jgi:DNA-binding response OmpR family regulator
MAITTAALRHALRTIPSSQLGLATLLASQRGKVFTEAEITDWLYGEDEDGGALGAKGCIRRAVWALRKRGVPIVCHERRGYSLPPRDAMPHVSADRWARKKAA